MGLTLKVSHQQDRVVNYPQGLIRADRIRVELHPGEMMVADFVGRARRQSAVDRNSKTSVDMIGNRLLVDIESCRAEMAVAKHTGLYWGGARIGDFDAVDVGKDIQVRQRIHPADNLPPDKLDLTMRVTDDTKYRYVCVAGSDGVYDLMGWIEGHLGKLPKYWEEPPMGWPCFFIPVGILKPMATLPVTP